MAKGKSFHHYLIAFFLIVPLYLGQNQKVCISLTFCAKTAWYNSDILLIWSKNLYSTSFGPMATQNWCFVSHQVLEDMPIQGTKIMPQKSGLKVTLNS